MESGQPLVRDTTFLEQSMIASERSAGVLPSPAIDLIERFLPNSTTWRADGPIEPVKTRAVAPGKAPHHLREKT